MTGKRSYAHLSPQPLSSEAIMSFLTIKLDEEPPICQRCGRKPRLVGKMLDPRKGETVRMFICECHELTRWPAVPVDPVWSIQATKTR